MLQLFFSYDVSLEQNQYESHITYYEFNSGIVRPVSKQNIEATTKRCINFIPFSKVNRAHYAVEIANRKTKNSFCPLLHLYIIFYTWRRNQITSTTTVVVKKNALS
jgi:hypothetical protein